jgi:hypothetical protein
VALLRALLLLALGAAAALGADHVLRHASSTAPASGVVDESEPGPGDPPVAWLDGHLAEVGAGRLVLQEGEGPTIRLERFAEGATKFLVLEPQGWRELGEDEVGAVEAGGDVCVEALLDGRIFFALRVFLGSSCGPTGPAG